MLKSYPWIGAVVNIGEHGGVGYLATSLLQSGRRRSYKSDFTAFIRKFLKQGHITANETLALVALSTILRLVHVTECRNYVRRVLVSTAATFAFYATPQWFGHSVLPPTLVFVPTNPCGITSQQTGYPSGISMRAAKLSMFSEESGVCA